MRDSRSGSSGLRVCLICSHGGHLTELLQLVEAFEGNEIFHICYDAETTRGLPRVYLIPNRPKSIFALMKNVARAWRIFRSERPDAIVSTGAEIAIPFVLVGRLLGIPSLYIECGAQVTRASGTGRIMYWMASAFWVQWHELREAYGPRAEFRGSLIDEATPPQ